MLRLLVSTALLLAAHVASAQAAGTCDGQMRGVARLALAQPDGTFRALGDGENSTFFGRAECECGTTDVSLEIDLFDALPASVAGVAEIWVGDSTCMNPIVRTSASNTTCEKIASPSIQDFTINSTAGATGGLHYAIPARALFSPFKHDCASAPPWSSNGVYVFVYTDVNNPLATCNLPLTESQQQPDPATDVTATWQDDGSVVVRWTPAPLGTTSPTSYDVLCAIDHPALSGGFKTVDFSQCTADGIVRRSLLDDNGGFIPAGSFKTPGSDPFSPPRPESVCAHVSAGEASATLRLAEASQYRFAVVAADAHGNFTASPTIALDAPPPAPAKHGGCSLGGRASVPPSALILAAAAFAFAVARRRAR